MYPIILRRWFLYLCVCVFVICKLRDLTLAFYWDESWVYAPAVKLMYAHGPSLLPDAIPVEYSRGHPLLFQAMCAGWMHVFGTSNVAMHSFALSLSVVLVVLLYEIMLRLFGMRAAMISIVLLLLDHVFFVDSSFVLNDIMLGLLFLLVIYFYTGRRYIATAICLTLAFYTKESGLVAGCIVGADIVVGIVRKERTREVMYKSLCLAIPLALIALFYIIQKMMLGWYLYPGHTSLIDLHPVPTFENLKETLKILFYKDSHFFSWGMALLLCVVVAATQIKIKYLVLLLPAFLVCLLLLFSAKDMVYYLLTAGTIAWVVLLLCMHLEDYTLSQERFIKLCVAMGVAYVYFCCVNFFEYRYLIPAILLAGVVVLSVLYDHLISVMKPGAFSWLLCVLIVGGVATFAVHNNELTIRDRIIVQQDLVDYMEANSFYDKKIFCYPFLERVHLADPKTGFLHTERSFKHVTELLEYNVELMIFNNIDPNAPDSLQHLDDFYLLHRIERRGVWVAVYKKR